MDRGCVLFVCCVVPSVLSHVPAATRKTCVFVCPHSPRDSPNYHPLIAYYAPLPACAVCLVVVFPLPAQSCPVWTHTSFWTAQGCRI